MIDAYCIKAKLLRFADVKKALGIVIFILLSVDFCMAAAKTSGISLKITNNSSIDRKGEVVEISDSRLKGINGKVIAVKTLDGETIPSQITYDGRLLIYGDFPAQSTTQYILTETAKAIGVESDTICFGQIRHDMQDDYTWENDRSGYRLYGPSFRAGGGKVSGYDIWTKSVDYPILKERYDGHMKYGISYHKDHGTGMDVYTVGPTLGAGMNALISGDSICYPVAYENCDILDNGPLRVTAKITCFPENIGNHNDVQETRIISLDRGSWLNKTTVKYDGLPKSYPITTGIVVHKQNKRGYAIDNDKRYLAYADLTDNPNNGNGVIFIGIVNPQLPDSISYIPFDKEVSDGVGQIQTFSILPPNSEYTYYWGAGWSKGGVKGMESWLKYLADFYLRLQTPLEIKID
ncbi:MAG: DUF4861 domain-containing protein [Muribaculaceae bacterium]|nr:DUF4861 domain-containing protein [Muribaculaceae bacterium]